MNTGESRHFLLSVVNSAEDISLFLDTYNACKSDDFLRNSVELNEKPLVIFGTKTRLAMCEKFLKKKLKALDTAYDEKRVTYVNEDEESMADFVERTLEGLRNAPSVEAEVTDLEEEKQLEEKEESKPVTEVEEEQQESIQVPEVKTIVEQHTSSTELKSTEEIAVGEEPTTTTEKPQLDSGLCAYGVPKIKVEYLPPNVLGLQESLFVDVSDEDISRFFGLVKQRVLNKITNDR
ncbi:hypothetical protein [Lysinibacillus xylanilyticus]|uniref:hypothetical protein n=1 Tax=Lysinibacillus xylanilyticus TaxID=582475 RepID=UPI0036DA2C08